MTTQLPAKVLVRGPARGPVLVLDEPLSLWGGVERETGRITDPHHPQLGALISGTILAMPFGRGSSTASSVLAEMIRLGTAPGAIVLSRADPIIVLGSLVATELYGHIMPVIVVEVGDFELLSGHARAEIDGERVYLTA